MSQSFALSQAAAAGAGAAMAVEASGAGAKRRKRNRSAAVSIARGGVSSRGFAFPQRYSTTLKYYDCFSMGAASTSLTWVFRANSLFDPDYTGTGHQPRGYDQLCSSTGPYVRYVVTGVKWIFHAAGSTDGWLGVNNQDSLNALTFDSQQEQRSCAKVYCPYANGGNQIPTLKFKTNIAKEAGVTLANLRTDDKYSALYTASPSENQAVNVAWQAYDETTTGTVRLSVWAEYKVEFYDIQLLPAS